MDEEKPKRTDASEYFNEQFTLAVKRACKVYSTNNPSEQDIGVQHYAGIETIVTEIRKQGNRIVGAIGRIGKIDP